MNEKQIYQKVLESLFEGMITDNHEVFKNDRLAERNFAINELYPDIILTKKDSKDVDFIVEIVSESYVNKETLVKKWKPLSEVGAIFYLLVPKNKHKIIQTWCLEEKLKVRFGTYEMKGNEPELKFF